MTQTPEWDKKVRMYQDGEIVEVPIPPGYNQNMNKIDRAIADAQDAIRYLSIAVAALTTWSLMLLGLILVK